MKQTLQETILCLNFILDYLFMSDVMSHLTNCTETVQQSSTLLWMYPETIDWTLATLKSIKDILQYEDVGTMSNKKELFPISFISPEIISSKQFKRCSFQDLPITATLTRQRKASTNSETFNFTNKNKMYTEYFSKPIEHNKKLFSEE